MRTASLASIVVVLAVESAGTHAKVNAAVVTTPAPAGEELSKDYDLAVGDKPVPVYTCRVSTIPFDQVWPGYQRPLNQTEQAGFAYWDMSAPVNVVVRSKQPVRSVMVRPISLGTKPTVKGDRVMFEMSKPGSVVVEINGSHRALHLFANPLEKDVPPPNAAGVRFFGPGVHHPGIINMVTNQTIYIASGAVVYGSIQANNVSNIRIGGRGIIDVSQFDRTNSFGAIRLTECSNAVISGIVLRDPNVWGCSLFGCRNAAISNVKLIGLWRYNADGIDICNSQDVTIRDSFIRSFDDSIVLKGTGGAYGNRPVHNVKATGCVIWNDWGIALEIGAETSAPEISDILFEDCDIIRATQVALGISHGDRATVRDVRYKNIRIELGDDNPRPRLQASPEDRYESKPGDDYLPLLLAVNINATPYSKDVELGNVRDVLLENVSVTGPRMPESFLRGFDAGHTVQGITINNLRFNGKPIQDATAAHLAIGPHVSDVRFK